MLLASKVQGFFFSLFWANVHAELEIQDIAEIVLLISAQQCTIIKNND